MVWGGLGCGKTTLMGRAAQAMPRDALTIYRSIGLTPDSATPRALLRSICEQLVVGLGLRHLRNMPLDFLFRPRQAAWR